MVKMDSCTGTTGGGQCSCRDEQNSDFESIQPTVLWQGEIYITSTRQYLINEEFRKYHALSVTIEGHDSHHRVVLIIFEGADGSDQQFYDFASLDYHQFCTLNYDGGTGALGFVETWIKGWNSGTNLRVTEVRGMFLR